MTEQEPEVLLQKKSDHIMLIGSLLVVLGYALLFSYFYLETEISNVVKGRVEHA